MDYWNKICGFVLILIFSFLFSSAQKITSAKLDYTIFFQKEKLSTPDSSVSLWNAGLTKVPIISLQSISPDFSTCSYGFFCRKELLIEKVTKIPFRFRLGSLQQCNYYEGKIK